LQVPAYTDKELSVKIFVTGLQFGIVEDIQFNLVSAGSKLWTTRISSLSQVCSRKALFVILQMTCCVVSACLITQTTRQTVVLCYVMFRLMNTDHASEALIADVMMKL